MKTATVKQVPLYKSLLKGDKREGILVVQLWNVLMCLGIVAGAKMFFQEGELLRLSTISPGCYAEEEI
jgi:hypothetical protein